MEFEKYNKIRQLRHEENEEIFTDFDDEIIIEEKIDGGNFRFMVHKEGHIIFGSRTQELDAEHLPDQKHLKNFKRCIIFVKERIKDKSSLPVNVLVYGECCIKHTMSYDWDNMPPYLGFDIKQFSEEGTKYWNYEMKKKMFDYLGLPMVPLIKICKAGDIKKITDEDVPKSFYPSPSAEDQQAEGIVFKNYKKQLFAKYVRDKFKEANSQAFGVKPKYNQVEDLHNLEFIFKYCTNARIDKMIFKLIDEGMKLNLKMMSKLPKRINLDIWEEHWQDIRDSNWMLDFKKIRKIIPRRCLVVLKQVMVNNSLNKEVI